MVRNIAVTVKGKVQGVWFRHFTEKEAVKLGLHGYVMNNENGTVYIEASGPINKIEQFLHWCKTGSPLSRVQNLQIVDSDIEYKDSFQIKR